MRIMMMMSRMVVGLFSVVFRRVLGAYGLVFPWLRP